MAWKEQLHPDVKSKDSDCKVRKCLAEDCKYNRDYKCTLPKIGISENGGCRQYSKTDDPRYIGKPDKFEVRE